MRANSSLLRFAPMSLLQSLSLGWQTDLIFPRFEGLVLERADCVVVRTPSNPLFYWGNCLILPQVPADADLAHWLQRFDEEVGCHTRESGHVAIGFDAAAPFEPLQSWQAAGFQLFATSQLELQAHLPRPLAAELPSAYFRFAPLDLSQPRQLDAAVELQCDSDEGQHEPEHYRLHRQRQMQRYAAMQAAGLGHWFGIWRGTQLVADCGLFRDGRLGRFQHVGTHPEWRRRGLCTALVEQVSAYGFGSMGLDRIIMCADPQDVAIGIYESIGYQRRSHCWGAQRPPSRDLQPQQRVQACSSST